MTTEQKIKKLELKLEKQREEGIARIRISDDIWGFEGSSELSLSLCPHQHKGQEERHWSASVGTASKEFTCARMIHLFEHFQPRMVSVPLISEPGCMPVFAPEAVNCSAMKEGWKKVSEEVVEMRQHGSSSFRSRSVSFWVTVPDVGWVEINLGTSTLPRDWDVGASYRRFCRDTGEPQSYTINAPRAGLPGLLRKNVGGAGTWDFTSYWDNAETFRADVLRAGV